MEEVKDAVEKKPIVKTNEYVINLAQDRRVVFKNLPEDLTKDEVKRIEQFLSSFIIN